MFIKCVYWVHYCILHLISEGGMMALKHKQGLKVFSKTMGMKLREKLIKETKESEKKVPKQNK